MITPPCCEANAPAVHTVAWPFDRGAQDLTKAAIPMDGAKGAVSVPPKASIGL